MVILKHFMKMENINERQFFEGQRLVMEFHDEGYWKLMVK